MKKPLKSLPPGSPQEWLSHALSDLALAHLGMDSEEVLLGQICFHAQQAVLLFNRISFPLVHDIEALIEIGQQAGINFPAWADEAATLTPYAVETRYPGYWEEFQDAEVHQATEIAKQTIEWAKSIIVVKG